MPIIQKIHSYTENNGDIYEEDIQFNSIEGGIHMKKHNDQVSISLLPPIHPGSAISTTQLLNKRRIPEQPEPKCGMKRAPQLIQPDIFSRPEVQEIPKCGMKRAPQLIYPDIFPESEEDDHTIKLLNKHLSHQQQIQPAKDDHTMNLQELLHRQVSQEGTDPVFMELMNSILDESQRGESKVEELQIEDITDTPKKSEESEDSDELFEFIEKYKKSQEANTDLYQLIDKTTKKQKNQLKRLKKQKLRYISEQLELPVENEDKESLTRKQLIENILDDIQTKGIEDLD